MRFLKTIIFVLFFTPAVWANDIDFQIQELIQKRGVEQLRRDLNSLKQANPNNSAVYYIEAFLESNGVKAFDFYRLFIEKFPGSPYINNAKYKIAQYFFAKGQYSSALNVLDDILTSPDVSFTDAVYYLKFCCLIASEQIADIEKELNAFQKACSQSPFLKLAELDLSKLKNEKSAPVIKSTTKTKIESDDDLSGYTIQVGAYRNRQNAMKQLQAISDLGYPANLFSKSVDHILFYVIWIGNFRTEEQAVQYGVSFQKKHAMSFQVVKKDIVSE